MCVQGMFGSVRKEKTPSEIHGSGEESGAPVSCSTSFDFQSTGCMCGVEEENSRLTSMERHSISINNGSDRLTDKVNLVEKDSRHWASGEKDGTFCLLLSELLVSALLNS
jgi:hypothetical protein